METEYNWAEEYRIVWVNSDYEIQETFVEAETKKKAIIKFFKETDAFCVENFKIKQVN
jgi:hypothetical protein